MPKEGLVGEYVYFLLTTMHEPLRALGRGASQPALDCSTIADLVIPIPPVVEQEQIVALIKQGVEPQKQLVGSIKSSIRLLLERRQSLITAAVTGQLDSSVYMPKKEFVTA